MEEKQHAGLLQFCLREHIATRKPPDKAAIQRLTKLFEILEKRGAAANLSVDEAFLIAAGLEASEINPIYTQLLSPVQGPWYILAKKIETSIPGHMDGLIQAARRFGVSASTLERLVELGQPTVREAD